MEAAQLRPSEDVLMEQEEKCRKSLRTLGKALVMRLFVTVLLAFALTRTDGQLWVLGLMAFVMVINLAGALPLVAEWKKQRHILREILDQYE